MMSRLKTALWRGRTAVVGLPYLWLLVFFLLPFLVILKISLSEMEGVAFGATW